MTFWFKEHYLVQGDRTQDQMLQAARSGKQNIAEGVEDGLLSAEMEMKLVNVARASLMELREDYEDYTLANGYRFLKDIEYILNEYCDTEDSYLYCYEFWIDELNGILND